MRRWLTRSMIPIVIASSALALSAGPASSSGDSRSTPLVTVLTGAQEAPGPGDTDGRGVFAGVVKGDTLCYVLVANRIEPAAAAHIHVAPAGEPGPIVVGLTPPNRVSADCITAVPDAQNTQDTLSESELAAILATPSDYYVNVHNEPFPAGAIRGQFR
ncbi:CHRD domain-containing protein [Jiangella asiatica]|uniref:CHRD domain-containing protein n=1 Tax=Jiangella asiatica TaxID=2530372 RepID=A0A4R5DCA6_9ACTN|nr:CHRD domain-containing protein [Jiangella asiatica]TDE09451.1 CHRD domain-containing protein [Jiangella asiatica]